MKNLLLLIFLIFISHYAAFSQIPNFQFPSLKTNSVNTIIKTDASKELREIKQTSLEDEKQLSPEDKKFMKKMYEYLKDLMTEKAKTDTLDYSPKDEEFKRKIMKYLEDLMTEKTNTDTQLPPPDDKEFMPKMYKYIKELMDKKHDSLITTIQKDYRSRVSAKEAEILNNKEINNILILNNELENLEIDYKKRASDVEKYIGGLKKEYDFKSRTEKFVCVFWKDKTIKNDYEAQIFYNQSVNKISGKFLSNSILNFGGSGEKISLFNEIFSDFIGPVRLGIGALVSNKSTIKDSTENQKDAVQRLLGGGGNMVLNLGYPLFGHTSTNTRLNIKSTLSPKISLDVPKLGTETGDYGVNCDAGIDAAVFYSGLLDILTIYSNLRIASVYGNAVFFNNLKRDQSLFSFNQFSIGIALNSTFRISWNTYFGGKFIKDNFPSTISFSIIPH